MNLKSTVERAKLIVEAIDLANRLSTDLVEGEAEGARVIGATLRTLAKAEIRTLSAEIQDAQTIEAFKQLSKDVAADVREAAVSGSARRKAEAIEQYAGLGVSVRMLNLLREGKMPLR